MSDYARASLGELFQHGDTAPLLQGEAPALGSGFAPHFAQQNILIRRQRQVFLVGSLCPQINPCPRPPPDYQARQSTFDPRVSMCVNPP